MGNYDPIAANRAHFERTKELRRELNAADVKIAELEKQVAFWCGEGQETRQEMIEYHKLVGTRDRTPEEKKRMDELTRLFEVEVESEPELRKRIAELELVLKIKNDRIAEHEKRAKAVVEAWGVLGEGRYASRIIATWLIDDMKPAMDKLRKG